ncbi:MAG TPA: TetR/AcrR family transcriptional regulator [Syntrophales bacterium]|nr:TetR/AcrR family transcriptional regulator [Syntrophales bacterium]
MERSKRKETEFQLKRTEILNEAEKIFAAKGFHNATMAEIASASGFGTGTLYHFFMSKESLYNVMVSEKLDRMYLEIREFVNNEEKIIDKINKLVESHFHFVENNVGFCDLLIRGEGLTLSDKGSILRDKIITDYLNHIGFVEDIMRIGMETNSLKSGDPRIMAYTLLGIIRSFFYYWMLTNQDTRLTDKVEFVSDIFLKGVGMRSEE